VALPSPILRRLSRLRRAMDRSSAAAAASWVHGRSRWGYSRGGDATRPGALPLRLDQPNARRAASAGQQLAIIHHERRAFLPQLLEVLGALPSLRTMLCCHRPGAEAEYPCQPTNRAKRLFTSVRK
jgi:hypothetical protein